MSSVDTNDPKELPEVVKYEITVKRITRNVKVRDSEYRDLGTKDKDGDTERGYVYFDKFVTKENEVYSQTVDDIDLPAVIKAVNGMEN